MIVYPSSEVARMLGVAPITLRKWSAEFTAFLIAAPAVVDAPLGDASERYYTDNDLRVLQYAAALLKQTRDYVSVRAQLSAAFGVTERERVVGEPEPVHSTPDPEPGVIDAEVIEPERRVPPDIAAMLARMSELYQELLRNKEQEIAALRQALDMTELAAANERRELEMQNKLTKMMERELQRLTAELEEARRQLGHAPASRRSWLARLFGRSHDKTQSAYVIHDT